MMRNTTAFFLIVLIGFLPSFVEAEVTPNTLFADHCVLQRGGPVPIWGSAEPGEAVTIRFRGNVAHCRADHTGRWFGEVKPGKAGGPFVLEIAGEGNSVRIEDVLVGEVWLASGQSNMERQLGPRGGQKPIVNGQSAAAKADYPRFRQFFVPQKTADVPLTTLEGSWSVCSPETANDFTAVGFFFGRELLAKLDLPIGIIHSSWGGTPAEAWTSEEAVSAFPAYAKLIERRRQTIENRENAEKQYAADLDAWCAENDTGSMAADPWSGLSVNERRWDGMMIPQTWEESGYKGFDGVGWLRTSFALPAKWAHADLVLSLGAIDDVDTTWVNGVKIGTTVGWTTDRTYTVPASILKAGNNVIAVRVLDTGGGGGIWDPKRPPSVALGNDPTQSLSLAGEWRFRKSVTMGSVPTPPRMLAAQNSPSMLYNAMIAPLVPYAMRGVIWYQGESNAGDPRGYRDLFPAMIEDWREQWSLGDFPFLYVQIAPYEGQPPEIREAQLLTLDRVEHVAMAVTIDVGDAEDIHPANKGPVGERLALAARALAYGEDLVYSGPVFESMVVEGRAAKISFTSVGPGLVAADGRDLHGFIIAGQDGVFQPAKAVIAGDEVIVSAPDVHQPIAVRYGWANVAEGNLFNRAGLPASPFRTDVE